MVAPLLILHGQRSPAPSSKTARPASGPDAVRSSDRPLYPLLGAQRVGFDTPLAATTPTTTAPVPGPVTTTTVAAPVVTTAVAPSMPSSAPPVAADPVETAAGSAIGQATWYAAAPPGGCASPSLPPGTVVQVVDDASGATATCVVDDREATNGGRVLDMSVTGFSQLASVTQGVVAVTVSW